MATYLPLQQQYIPSLKPFTPDFGFLGDVLQKRQDRYDDNYELLNDAYGRILNADLTRPGNQAVRDQYANDLSNKMKQVSGLDLSLGRNVQAAKALFKPFYDNDKIVQDMVYTKGFQREAEKMNSYLNSDDPKIRAKYWDMGAEDLQHKMEKFRDDPEQEAYSMAPPKYVNNPDIWGRAQEILKNSGLEIEKTTIEGDYHIKMKNGPLLLSQITGVDSKTGQPIKRSPAMEYLYQELMRDPQVALGMRTEAEVMARRWSKENAQKYGGVEAALKQWANNQIGESSNDQTQKLATTDTYITTLMNNLDSWKKYRKKHGMTEAEEELYNSQMAELQLLNDTRRKQKENLIETAKPAENMNSLLNSAYGAYMNFHLFDRMKEAAISHADKGSVYEESESDFYKKRIAHEFEMLRIEQRHLNTIKEKNHQWKLDNGALLDSKGFPVNTIYDENGTIINKEILENTGYFVANDEAYTRYENAYADMQWQYIEGFMMDYPDAAKNLNGGNPAYLKYSIKKENGDLAETTTTLATAKKYLLENAGPGSELERIFKQLVKIRQSGSDANMKVPTKSGVKYADLEDHAAIYQTMLGEGLNKYYGNTEDFSNALYETSWQSEKNLGIPPIAMSELEYELLTKHGVLLSNPTSGSKIITIQDVLSGNLPENFDKMINQKNINNSRKKLLSIQDYENMFVNMAKGDSSFLEYINSQQQTAELANGSFRHPYWKKKYDANKRANTYTFNEEKARKDARDYYEDWQKAINKQATSSQAGPGGPSAFNMDAFMHGVSQGVEETPGGMVLPSYKFIYDHMNPGQSQDADKQLKHIQRLINNHGTDIIIADGDASERGPGPGIYPWNWVYDENFRGKRINDKSGDAKAFFDMIMTQKSLASNNNKGLKLSILYKQITGNERLTDDDKLDDMYTGYVITTMPQSGESMGVFDEAMPQGKTITVLVPRKIDNNPYMFGNKVTDGYNVYLNNFGTLQNKIDDGGQYMIFKDSNNNLMAQITNYAWDSNTNKVEPDNPYILNLSQDYALDDRGMRSLIESWNQKFFTQQKINWDARNRYCVSCKCCK
tara:strand:- start:4036 stop:7233 length:3198 start_codon:yes stop_codon:yes gene_type:complete